MSEDRIEADMRELEAGLASIEPGFDADRAVAIATESGESDDRRPSGSRARPAFGRFVARGSLRWTVPALASAAAGIWAIVSIATPEPEPLAALVRVAELPAPNARAAGAPVAGASVEAAPELGVVPEEREAFSVSAPDSGRVAVFQTSNPKIRVVWFYDDASGE